MALAILDVQMPEIDGFELAERMRRNPQTCSVSIIFLTGHDAARSRTFQGYEANTDVLTGISNRRHVLQLAAATLSDRRQQAKPLSLAICDLDHFKAINDTHGHDVGDAVLRAFCLHVTEGIRTSHTLGRIGGEEFLLLMPGTFLNEAELVLQRLHRTLNSHDGVKFTFSAGIAQADAGEGLQALIKRADEALYEAKRAGRNCSVTSAASL